MSAQGDSGLSLTDFWRWITFLSKSHFSEISSFFLNLGSQKCSKSFPCTLKHISRLISDEMFKSLLEIQQLNSVAFFEFQQVDITADIMVPGFTSRKLGQIPCEDVAVRIPIPECWIYLFRVEKHFRYGSVKSAHRRCISHFNYVFNWRYFMGGKRFFEFIL